MSTESKEVIFNLEGQAIAAQLTESDWDTAGHVLAGNEIAVDVEGHAMTLRLPNAADAAAIKRALAVGAVTAALAGGGLVAISMAQPQAATQAPPITAPRSITQPVPMSVTGDEGLADKASQAASAEFAQSYQPKSVAAPVGGAEGPKVLPPNQNNRPGVE